LVLETAIALVFIFAVLVMFHELGHFIAARAVGIRVEEFALGFGPKLIRLFKRGDTEYTIHPVPLGGFVKLAGMEPGEEDIPDGFQAQTRWKRALVIFAGPFASFVLAVVVFLFVGVYFGFPDLTKPANRVGMVNPETEAARIGLRAGDWVIRIDGTRITNGRQMTNIIHASPGKNIRLVIKRDDRNIVKVGTAQWMISYLGASWSFMLTNHAKVESVFGNSPAKRAGIQPEDELVSINGRRIIGGREMVEAIEAARDMEVTIKLMRDGKPVIVKAKPNIEWVRFAGVKWGFPGAIAQEDVSKIRRGDKLISVNGRIIKSGLDLASISQSLGYGNAVKKTPDSKLRYIELKLRRTDKFKAAKTVTVRVKDSHSKVEIGYYDAIGLLGFLPEPTLVRAGIGESVARGLSDTGQKALLLIRVLTSKEIKESVGGPLMIASVTKSAVALGPYWILSTLAGLSLSLAFINLIPIPILDGGHLMIIAVEAVRRKRITKEQMQVVQAIGLAMIALLFVFVMLADIAKFAGGKVPQ